MSQSTGGCSARIVVARLLGSVAGVVGFSRLAEAAGESPRHLIVVSGTEGLDPESLSVSNVSPAVVQDVATYLRAGGHVNFGQCLRFLADHFFMTGFGYDPPAELPEHGIYHPDFSRLLTSDEWRAQPRFRESGRGARFLPGSLDERQPGVRRCDDPRDRAPGGERARGLHTVPETKLGTMPSVGPRSWLAGGFRLAGRARHWQPALRRPDHDDLLRDRRPGHRSDGPGAGRGPVGSGRACVAGDSLRPGALAVGSEQPRLEPTRYGHERRLARVRRPDHHDARFVQGTGAAGARRVVVRGDALCSGRGPGRSRRRLGFATRPTPPPAQSR